MKHIPLIIIAALLATLLGLFVYALLVLAPQEASRQTECRMRDGIMVSTRTGPDLCVKKDAIITLSQ